MSSSNIVFIDVKIEKHNQGEVHTAWADIMTVWNISGHLFENGHESSDKHLADAPLHPNHLDSTSKRLIQAGEHRTQLVLVTILPWRWMITCTAHEHFGYQTNFRSKADSDLRMWYLLCFIVISKSPVWWCSRKKMEPSRWIVWSHNFTSISQKKVRGWEGREQQSFYFFVC